MPPGCTAEQVRVLPTTVRLAVKDNGEIQVGVSGTGCLDRIPPNPLRADEAFTFIGGLGKYAGASGGGQLSSISYGPPNFGGKDTWTGTLTVPGLSFDLTPPTLTAPASKTIRVPRRVKRIRVSYVVTARDDVDGAVPVSCQPRSGSQFPLGRTPVRCLTADTSGNASKASFVVTLKGKA
jgi:HYR domain